MARVEARHDHAPLAFPDLAVGAEQAGLQAHLRPTAPAGRCGGSPRGGRAAPRPRLVVGHHQHGAGPCAACRSAHAHRPIRRAAGGTAAGLICGRLPSSGQPLGPGRSTMRRSGLAHSRLLGWRGGAFGGWGEVGHGFLIGRACAARSRFSGLPPHSERARRTVCSVGRHVRAMLARPGQQALEVTAEDALLQFLVEHRAVGGSAEVEQRRLGEAIALQVVRLQLYRREAAEGRRRLRLGRCGFGSRLLRSALRTPPGQHALVVAVMGALTQFDRGHGAEPFRRSQWLLRRLQRVAMPNDALQLRQRHFGPRGVRLRQRH